MCKAKGKTLFPVSWIAANFNSFFFFKLYLQKTILLDRMVTIQISFPCAMISKLITITEGSCRLEVVFRLKEWYPSEWLTCRREAGRDVCPLVHCIGNLPSNASVQFSSVQSLSHVRLFATP